MWYVAEMFHTGPRHRYGIPRPYQGRSTGTPTSLRRGRDVMSGSWDANKEQNNEPRIRFLGHLDCGDVTPSSDFLWYRYYLIRWSLVRVSELCNVNRETVSVKRTSGHSLVLPLNTCCNIDSMIFAVILLLRVLCDDSVLKYTFYLIYTRLTIYSTIA